MFPQSVEKLMQRGYEALEQGDDQTALKIGQKLLKKRHTSGFELSARALWDLNRPDEAIKMLEDGVAKAPGIFNLWDYLGCYYSDLGRYDEALRALSKALECETGSRDATLYNTALVHQRKGDFAAALDVVRQIHGRESLMPRPITDGLETGLLVELARYNEAIALADRSIESLQGRFPEEIEEAQGVARMLAWRGHAKWRERHDRDGALADAWHATQHDRINPVALNLIREIEALRSNGAKLFNLLIEGVTHEPIEGDKGVSGFITAYDVAADDEDEALHFCRRFFPQPMRPGLRISESKIVEDTFEEPKGVVRGLGGLIFFSDEEP